MINILYTVFLLFIFYGCSRISDNVNSNDNFKRTNISIGQNNKNATDTDLMADKFQSYISNMGNVRGKFIQKSSNGEEQRGDFYISIPGKMRINYKNDISILADGHDFIYYDASNDQITVLDLKSSPAGVLLSNSSLDSIGAKITNIVRKNGITYLYIIIKNNLFNSQVVFKITEEPFELIGWIVRDMQGITTDFSIVELDRVENSFDENLFILKRKKSYAPGNIRSDDY